MPETFPSILCADDDIATLDRLKEYFTLQGFIVLTATNGVEACLQVKRWAPRAVILDLFIPRLGGIGALGRIHAMDPTLPVIITTDSGEGLAMVSSAGASLRSIFEPCGLRAQNERAMAVALGSTSQVMIVPPSGKPSAIAKAL